MKKLKNLRKFKKMRKLTQIHIYRRDINVSMSRGYWNMFISQKTRSQKNLIFFMFWSISARWAHLFLSLFKDFGLRNTNARSHTQNHFQVLIQIEKVMSNFGEIIEKFVFSVNLL